jgi:hypothetical protein
VRWAGEDCMPNGRETQSSVAANTNRERERTLELEVRRKRNNLPSLKPPVLVHLIRREPTAIPDRGEVEHREHLGDDDLVRRVGVEALVERERDGVIVERRVRARPVLRDRRVREPREQLHGVPCTLRARSRCARPVAVVVVQVERVLEAFPLGSGEEAAEGGVPERDGLQAAYQTLTRKKKEGTHLIRA